MGKKNQNLSNKKSRKTTPSIVGKKTKASMIEKLPEELVIEILSRVAASSLVDISNVRLSSKNLNEFAEDPQVYRTTCLDKIPIVSWTPLNEKQQKFLSKCQESGNPELPYREALLDFFSKVETRSACQKLDKALKSGHMGALYVSWIILLFCGDDEMKRWGIKMIGDVKKSRPSIKRKLKLCREKLIAELKSVWVKNPILRERPMFCTTHRRRNQWADEEDDYECEACFADREVGFISSTYNV